MLDDTIIKKQLIETYYLSYYKLQQTKCNSGIGCQRCIIHFPISILYMDENNIPHYTPLFLKDCDIGHLKTRLLPDLKLSHNVSIYLLFKLCKFHEK